MTWGWRKILQLRPIIRAFIWFRIGDETNASAWYDQWSHVGPLSRIVTTRDMFRAGFNLETKVEELICNGRYRDNLKRLSWHSCKSVIAKQVLTGECMLSLARANAQARFKTKRDGGQTSVRLKLLSCSFKKTKVGMDFGLVSFPEATIITSS
ncbi:hypothetical protein Tco_0853750 [Tanacetum coccineum]